ncbi:MAG: hypothetical protein HS108_01035 [Planctomycetes bacterium]|nr:hypothetical protein [Planctomycetota bacterium]MCL4730264.1 hypothetical protein [Planctomycetota bacterium]
MKHLCWLLALCLAAACSGDKGSGSGSGGGSSSSSSSGDSGPAADAPSPQSKVPVSDTLTGKELQPGVQYEAGERIQVPSLGASFVVPPGCVAAYPPGGLAMIVRDASKPGLGLVLLQTGMTKDGLRKLLEQPLDLNSLEQGLVLQARGEIEEQGDRLTRRFSNGFYTTDVTGIVAPYSFAGFSYLVPEADAERGRALVKAMADSAKFAKPKNDDLRKQWNDGLKGKCLHVFKYRGSGYSSGGSSWSSETNRYWHFGSDGTYIYSGRTTNSASVEVKDGLGNPSVSGGFAADNDNDHAGRWKLEFNLVGAVLVLESSQGTVRVHTLAYNGRVYIDGDEAGVSPSQYKQ